jgi:hypothetical protein
LVVLLVRIGLVFLLLEPLLHEAEVLFVLGFEPGVPRKAAVHHGLC